MKKISETISVPRKCISNLILSLTGVIVLVCAAIIPAYLSRAALEQKISDARYRLNQHQTLLPLYTSLKKAPQADLPALAAPVKTALKRADIDIALTAVKDIAGKSAITVSYINPDLSGVSANTQSLAVDLLLKGKFENFRTVLADIGALPYVESVEDLSIQQEPDNGQALDLKMTIILSVS